MPQFYKYTPINLNALQCLTQRSLWASLPTDFNDPFEMSASRAGLLEQVRRHGLHIESTQPEDDAIELLCSQMEQAVRKLGVVCFSSKHDVLTMWAHYADSHKGMCLAFDVPDGEIGTALHEVQYSDELPAPLLSPEVLALKLLHQDGLFRLVCTKGLDWRHEKEYRLVSVEGRCYRPYIGRLSEVIFGSRSTPESRSLVYDVLSSVSGVEFWVAALDPTGFRLKRDEYERG